MAAPTTSANFSWLLPTEGASSGVWAQFLNDVISGTVANSDPFEGIDSIVGTIKTKGDTAIQKDGSVSMTGELDILTERYVSVGAGTSGTVTLDLDAGNFFYLTPSGTVTFAFSNVPAGPDVVFIQIEFTNGQAQSIFWPSPAVEWPGATPAVFSTGVDLVTGYTRDGGTTWHLALAMSNSD